MKAAYNHERAISNCLSSINHYFKAAEDCENERNGWSKQHTLWCIKQAEVYIGHLKTFVKESHAVNS